MRPVTVAAVAGSTGLLPVPPEPERRAFAAAARGQTGGKKQDQQRDAT